MLKINILSILVTGLLVFFAGGMLLFVEGFISRYIRFFLPIPPLAVASYVFVFNMFKYFDGDLPAGNKKLLGELIFSTLAATLIFGLFTVALVVFVGIAKKYL